MVNLSFFIDIFKIFFYSEKLGTHQPPQKMHKNIIELEPDKIFGDHLFERCSGFLGSIVQINSALNGQTRIFQNLFSIVNIGTFKPDNQWKFKIDTSASIDNSIGDGGTINNTTKHVHENCFNLFIFTYDTECFSNLS